MDTRASGRRRHPDAINGTLYQKAISPDEGEIVITGALDPNSTKGLTPPLAWVEEVPQRIAEEGEAHHRQGDENAWESDNPRGPRRILGRLTG